jgi:hypothetical protein
MWSRSRLLLCGAAALAIGCGSVTASDPDGGAGQGGAAAGAGGGAAAGAGGGAAGAATGGAGGSFSCQRGACPALAIADLTDMDTAGVPGFNAVAFRCKALAICSVTGSCVYYSNDQLGHAQSMESFIDGAEIAAAPVKLYLQGGAASQCNNPEIQINAGDTLVLTFDGKKLTVYLPTFNGKELTLYIASDGSTFYDAALAMTARLRP